MENSPQGRWKPNPLLFLSEFNYFPFQRNTLDATDPKGYKCPVTLSWWFFFTFLIKTPFPWQQHSLDSDNTKPTWTTTLQTRMETSWYSEPGGSVSEHTRFIDEGKPLRTEKSTQSLNNVCLAYKRDTNTVYLSTHQSVPTVLHGASYYAKNLHVIKPVPLWGRLFLSLIIIHEMTAYIRFNTPTYNIVQQDNQSGVIESRNRIAYQDYKGWGQSTF